MNSSVTLLLANLDFENELAGAVRPLPPGYVQRWRCILRLLPGMADSLCGSDPENIAAPVSRALFWGVTPTTYALAQSLGLSDHFPPPEVVRQVNDKRFSHQLEQRLGICLPGSLEVSNSAQLEQAVRDCPHDWVLKHPFGFSGRERILGKQNHLSPSAAGWARRKFAQGWSLVFEPWVYQRQDSSYHFQIHPSGTPEWLGFTSMLSDASGVYRGTQVSPCKGDGRGSIAQVSPWKGDGRGLMPDPQVLDCLQVVAGQVAAQGYFGPLGIDSFSGHLDGHFLNRPLVEINARYSFGRLALALRDWLPPDCSYIWHHPKQPLASPPPPLPLPHQVSCGLYSLPEAVDPEARSQTYLEVTHFPGPTVSLPYSNR